MAYIIAEIGFGHGGDVHLAVKMIEAAAKAGVNAVKFQSFHADDLYMPGEGAYDIFKHGELSEFDHTVLRNAAGEARVDFMSTPFSLHWVKVLEKLKPAGYKVASMDINNLALLEAVARPGRKVYLSTGGACLEEIRVAVKTLWDCGAEEVIVMHCVSNYPTKPEDAALYMIPTLKAEMGTRVGFSDHTLGTALTVAAVAIGAVVIEKHFTLDKTLPGPDHAISADPEEMRSLVNAVHEVEKALVDVGQPRADFAKRPVMRRGIYAVRDIAEGETVTPDMLRFVRPEVTPLSRLGDYLNKPAGRGYKKGEAL